MRCPDCDSMNTHWMQSESNPNTKKVTHTIACKDCDDIKQIVKEIK